MKNSAALSLKDLAGYKFDTSQYSIIKTPLRRDGVTGRLFVSTDIREAESKKSSK